MENMMKVLIPILTFVIVFAFSQAETPTFQPQQVPPEFLNLNETQKKDFNGNSSYTAVITTSCYSPRRTRDHISLAFGDKYGVCALRLDDLSSGTFSRCTSDWIGITGPCTSQICYVYLYRSGFDGWKPRKVTVSGTYSKSVTFYFNTLIPNQAWYGFNLCQSSSPSSATAY